MRSNQLSYVPLLVSINYITWYIVHYFSRFWTNFFTMYVPDNL